MSPASYLTAPPRVAVGTIATSGRNRLRRAVASIAGVSLTLACLLVSLVVVIVSLAMATVRGLRLYRDAKRLSKAIGETAGRIERSMAQIEVHLSAASASGERLSASLERLGRSRARLSVLLTAFAAARATLTRFGAVVPRK